MRRGLTWIACLAVVAPMPRVSKADPIQATVTMSVEELTSTGSDATVIGGPYQSSGNISDLNALPSSINLSGPNPGSSSFLFTHPVVPSTTNVQSTFNLTISLDGASGSHPSIDVTGPLTGSIEAADISQALQGIVLTRSEITKSFQGVATSASLQGWTPTSGIPMSRMAPLLDPRDLLAVAVGRLGQYHPSHGVRTDSRSFRGGRDARAGDRAAVPRRDRGPGRSARRPALAVVDMRYP
jgi:hypothetical protein